MSQLLSLIPDTAPFNEEQRAWLNGFLAGWIGLQGGDGAQTAETLSAPSQQPGLPEKEAEEEFPWHDPALTMLDRLEMAAGKPIQRRLMAAMAQLDCGSCGYDCQRYGEAIAAGEEKCLTLCSPGGKATSQKLKELVSLEPPAATKGETTTPASAARNEQASPTTWTRNHPFPARVHALRDLNQTGSAKQTTHVEIDLSGSGIEYQVGDALGIYPTNCVELVQAVIGQLHASGDELIPIDGQQLTLQAALLDHFCLHTITDELIECMSTQCGDLGQAGVLKQLLENSDSIDDWDVFDLLKHYSAVRLTASQLTANLERMKPRLYSISSSPKAHPGQVHLTVGRVSWKLRDRLRKGVASTMFADRLRPADPIRVFVHRAKGFTVPADPHRPMIMIGPGTGIAPFRAFLEERQATGATGRNWLFFGEQRAATDFLYQSELQRMQETGLLTRCDVAFSRDQSDKIYVQDRMREQGQEFWKWLEQGASVYVCGDARRMAVDVDRALRQIIVEFGGKDNGDADRYVAQMVQAQRYCRDVY